MSGGPKAQGLRKLDYGLQGQVKGGYFIAHPKQP